MKAAGALLFRITIEYPVRVAHAFLALLILAIPAIVIAWLVARRGERSRMRMARAISVIAVVVLAGALFAAKGVWDPAYRGGPFAAAAVPAGIAAAASRSDPRRVSMIVMAVIIAFPVALLFSGFGRVVLLWLAVHGLPVTW